MPRAVSAAPLSLFRNTLYIIKCAYFALLTLGEGSYCTIEHCLIMFVGLLHSETKGAIHTEGAVSSMCIRSISSQYYSLNLKRPHGLMF